jgi:DNA-binding response OmpR family regulator
MRVLVAEDKPRMAGLLQRALQREGYLVSMACDGEQALTMGMSGGLDLMVLDVMLPGRDGFDVIKHLRAAKQMIPTIMVTARDSMSDIVRGLDLGADDYLTKPFAFAELLVRIKALLRRGQANNSNAIRIGDLEIDRLSHQVKRDGVNIKLTLKEYGLLEYLALNAGRVLSRTMIIEHVWDQSFEGLTNIVDVYIRQLRAKVDEPFAGKLIHTVRSAGYMLTGDGA